MNSYIIVMRDEGYFLVGPFIGNEEAGDFGTEHLSHDPRWQVVRLTADKAAKPPVVTPDIASALANA